MKSSPSLFHLPAMAGSLHKGGWGWKTHVGDSPYHRPLKWQTVGIVRKNRTGWPKGSRWSRHPLLGGRGRARSASPRVRDEGPGASPASGRQERGGRAEGGG